MMLLELLSLLLQIATGIAMALRFRGSPGAILGGIAFGVWVMSDVTRRIYDALDVAWWNFAIVFWLSNLAGQACLLAAVLTAQVNPYDWETLRPKVSCPKCNAIATRGGIPAWQIILAICMFPIGLLALLGGRKPTQCPKCTFIWQA